MAEFYLKVVPRASGASEREEKARLGQLSTNLLFEYVKTLFLSLSSELAQREEKLLAGVGAAKDEQEVYAIVKENEALKRRLGKLAELLGQSQKWVAQLEQEKAAARCSTLAIIENFRKNAEKLVGLFEAREGDVEALRIELQEKEAELRQLQERVQRTDAAERECEELRYRHFNALAEAQKALDQEGRAKLKAEKESTAAGVRASLSQEKVRFLSQELHNFKTMFHQRKAHARQLDRAREKLEKDAQLCAKKDTELACLRSRLREKDAQLERLRRELKGHLAPASPVAPESKGGEAKGGEGKGGATAALVEEYKARCAEKDRQLGELLKRFKKYNLAEKRGPVLQMKEFAKREQQYEQLVTALKRKLRRQEQAVDGANSSQSSQAERSASASDEDQPLHSPGHGVVLRAGALSAKRRTFGSSRKSLQPGWVRPL